MLERSQHRYARFTRTDLDNTPMGANLTAASGATFRVWAPHAHRVHACRKWRGGRDERQLAHASRSAGDWRGFLARRAGPRSLQVFVVGDGGSGPKRDPFARELATPFPDDCVIRATGFSVARGWIRHAAVSRFRDLSVARRRIFDSESAAARRARFSMSRARFHTSLASGSRPIQLMPIQEFATQFSLGYNGVDYFSPEMDFAGRGCGPAAVSRAVKSAPDRKGLAPYAIG